MIKSDIVISMREIINNLRYIFEEIEDENIDFEEKVEFINQIKIELKNHSPLKNVL